ncbi:hypothetical protein JCM8097_009465 [Rhodosporidiobolus ruineniae]
MRIVSWNVGNAGKSDSKSNIEGLYALKTYEPGWRGKSWEAILDQIGGDIICIQETKLLLSKPERWPSSVPGYDVLFSHNQSKRKTTSEGRALYGVATFTKRESVVPVKAEEGVGSALFASMIAVSGRIGGYPPLARAELQNVDKEGRVTVQDLGLFVLINLYAVNESSKERFSLKNEYDEVLEQRIRNLVAAGREVIVVGDFNITVELLDTDQPWRPLRKLHLEQKYSFDTYPPRVWMRRLVAPGGLLVDVLRERHPDRQSMFTYSEHGASISRVDYVLVTPGLLPWVSSADLLPLVRGSDHTPIYLDLHDELDIPGRGKFPPGFESFFSSAKPPSATSESAPAPSTSASASAPSSSTRQPPASAYSTSIDSPYGMFDSLSSSAASRSVGEKKEKAREKSAAKKGKTSSNSIASRLSASSSSSSQPKPSAVPASPTVDDSGSDLEIESFREADSYALVSTESRKKRRAV